MVNMNPQDFQKAVQQASDAFAEAVKNADFFNCVKQVGVLEFLGHPDVEFLTGQAYHVNYDFSNAIKHLSLVKKDSPYYSLALDNLSYDYTFTGNYEKLCEVLKQKEYKKTPMEKVHQQVMCLQHVKYDEVPAIRDIIYTDSVVDVPADNYSGYQAELFFGLCRMFSIALVIAGECINQCLLYQIRNGKELTDFQPTPDVQRLIDEYEKWCIILSFSSRLKKFVFAENTPSLVSFALREEPWPQKLITFHGDKYAKQILKTIHQLLAPEIHPTIPAYTCVERFLETVSHIMPQAIPQVIDQYFSIIAEAYNAGSNTAPQYLGYAYAEIIANGSDPFSLKERIESIRKSDDNYDSEEVAERIKLTRSMSRKGHEALMNVLYSYAQSSEKEPGANDFSALALQFFRVLEIEYSEKILLPLVGKLDLKKLELFANTDSAWNADRRFFTEIKNGERASIQIGAMRKLLDRIYVWRGPAAKYIRKNFETLLTKEGKNAFQNETMLNVINQASADRYRVPGAHTGYLPFSVATEAREYVLGILPEIETWFI